MKNAIKILICSFLGMFSAHSQEIQVDYSMVITFDESLILTSNASLLSKNKMFSIFEEDGSSKILKNKDSDAIKTKSGMLLFKDFSNEKITNKDLLVTDRVYVEDNLKLFNWTINNDIIDILGYKCQQATCEHRGRKYTAYFAKEIPVFDGPWKFNGLPGLILKVASEDKFISFTAESIKFSINREIKNPFEGEKLIAFSKYKQEYVKAYNKLLNYRKYGDDGLSYSSRQISKGGIELYVD